MEVNELLDDDTFDPKKLFDEKKYNTLIIDRGGFNKKENSTADLLEALLDKDITRQESEAIFVKLKEKDAQIMLVDAIKTAKLLDEKAVLTAACWESGLDFSTVFLFFVELACSADYRLAMEALTVVENCEGKIENEVLLKALETAQSSASKHTELTNMLLENIKQRLS